MWGKWAQTQKKKSTQILLTQRKSYELLTSPGTEVTNLIFLNNEVACFTGKYSENNVAEWENVNLAVAAYVTTQARLRLYEYMNKLETSFLYCDTDSVIYIQNVDEPPEVETGYFLVTSQMRWRSLDLAPPPNSLYRVAIKIMHFLYLAPRQESVHTSAK